ncbi:ABC transporter permease [Acholeplasma hippikon]|uniref:Ribose ABC transporter permease protein n=1 Tax=Acholeplasma hippikon TaxID=264636 RepID=A0A449BI19_9MOLU|nr:ABC transporter permease [Acholeplasma hippikon]VEU82096.1 ribose ABC transporter permease protein [Acholeplasma hippikon]
MDIVISLIQYSLIIIAPLLIVALGGLMSEKSGVTNIALEGIMLMGAFIGIWAIRILQLNTTWNPQIIYIIGMLVGGLTGLIFAAIHAFASIKMKADQTISATALNLFAPAFAIFTARTVIGGQQVKFRGEFLIQEIPFLSKIPFIGDIFFKRIHISFFIAIIFLVVITLLFNKSKLGLRVRAVGENPHAAQSLGVNISKIRFFGVLSSGFLAGLGGVIYVATTSESFDATVAGMGFLAIAVLIFGNWKPLSVLLAAIFFGFFSSFAYSYSLIPFLKNNALPKEFMSMIPYVVTLIILAFTSKRSLAPKALGQVFDQEKR